MFRNLTKRSVHLSCSTARLNIARQASNKASNATAYKEALELIELDKNEKMNMLKHLEKEISTISKTATPIQMKQLEALKFDLQVKAELNDPNVQNNFKLGNIDMSKPVYRYMRQRQFEKTPKSKLMKRLTQMNVIPDLLSSDLNPTVEIAVNLPEGQVEPGVFIQPEQSMQRPEIQVTNFHPETRLYTLMLVDPDSPDIENKTYQQHCHWLVANVPLSTTSSIVEGGDTVLDYTPPHPQKGTKYHRYTLIAYEQPNEGQDKINVTVQGRDQFDTKSFANTFGLKATGATFFRQVWNENVSKIYSEILKQHEPIYGKPPKVERYIQRTVYY